MRIAIGCLAGARCLDEGTVEAMTIKALEGRDWEKSHPGGRGKPLEE